MVILVVFLNEEGVFIHKNLVLFLDFQDMIW